MPCSKLQEKKSLMILASLGIFLFSYIYSLNLQGFINCSRLNHLANPIQTTSWAIIAIQNHAFPRPLAPNVAFGNTAPGPSPSGEHALPTIVVTLPSTWLPIRTKVTWNLVSVCSKIIPNPTPWTASRTPSQSHSARPMSAPDTGEPIHGSQTPIPEVAHHIWHQRGAPREMAKMGRIQVCVFDKCQKMAKKAAQTKTKNKITSPNIAPAGAQSDENR